MQPNPEVFAKTVLAELSRLRAETIALRLRLYQHMTATPGWEMTLEQMDRQDKAQVEKYTAELLRQSLKECGLTPGSTPPDTER
jgi:hypothetical protein